MSDGVAREESVEKPRGCFRRLVVAVLLLIGGCVVWYQVWSRLPPPLPEGEIERVDVEYHSYPGHEHKDATSCADPQKMNALVSLLREGRRASDHKCGDSGKLILRMKDGSTTTIGILPGHHGQYYEYRIYTGKSYSMYRVDRQTFLLAMSAMGVTKLFLGIPDQSKK